VAAPRFIVHVSRSGERWDLLAWKYYGDPSQYRPVIMANPEVAIEPVFEAGLTIVVPIIEQSAVEEDDLPPWREERVS
jgi:phage tail protein X